MTLFSTITHGEAPQLRSVSPRGLGTFALILIIGVALGYALSTLDLGAESSQAPVATLDHAAFLQVNTADLEWLEPIIPEVATSRADYEVDPFIRANVSSYAALNEPWKVDETFTKVNTDLGVFGPYDAAEAARLRPFVATNVDSYDGLVKALEERHSVDPAFMAVNTELPSTYVEPESGPR
jgi:hypothetical protein